MPPDTDQEGTPGFTLFLYGTLRPGKSHHGLIAPHVMASAPARLWGRLYHVQAGYPAVTIPEAAVLACGTADPVADAAVALAVGNVAVQRTPGDWNWVYGDVVTLRDPAFSVPPVDAYEDFRPGLPCLYQRVLVAAESAGGVTAAWTYVKAPSARDVRLPGGVWNPAQNEPPWSAGEG